MADAVTRNVHFSGSKHHIVTFTNVSDGTGEITTQKVDISTLSGTPSNVRICKVYYCVSGMQVQITYDHTADDTVLVLSGSGEFEFHKSPLPDPASAGGSGDILFTTIGASLNDSYTIHLIVTW